MKLLDQQQINQKVKRLAIQILEDNYTESEIFLIGINNNGYEFAKLLKTALRRRTKKVDVNLGRIKLNPADPANHPIESSIDVEEFNEKVVIIVDDVANTGRTLFYACKPLMEITPLRIEVAVLVDRTHKTFPIKVDYVGISLATTLQDNIAVKIVNVEEKEVHLQ
ncbi:MAG: phosphoribosyltransferase [Saprospiraceae bacterium]|nr:phosphoribosyltransferase [Saprospiraceae bacterium]